MLKTYHGSCHCGAVVFEADLDLAQGTSRCNCTFCAAARHWAAYGQPGDLRVTRGEDRLGRYSAESGATHEHCFCATCGIRLFSRGKIEEMGPFLSVQVTALKDARDDVFAAPVKYLDGLHDNWWNPPAETRHL
jgi:hypothetical protein